MHVQTPLFEGPMILRVMAIFVDVFFWYVFSINLVLANYFEGHVTFQNIFFKIILFNGNYFDNSLA